MERYAFVALASLVLAGGCDRTKDAGMDSERPAPNNTRVNERDRDRDRAITPLDQGNNEADLNTTQQIRQALMSEDGLSMDARNVKVITNAGVVTLRGPVKSSAERSVVENIARQHAGTNRVDVQLEVSDPEAQRNPPERGWPHNALDPSVPRDTPERAP